jgi:hypothetical protein
MEAGGDVLGHERRGVRVAIGSGQPRVDPDDVEVVGVDTVPRPADRLDAGERQEASVVALNEVGSVGSELVDSRDLGSAAAG